jgi:hypothetical protein
MWRPKFLSSVIKAKDRINQVKHRWHWYNLGQHGSSPRKLSQQSRMTFLIESTPTLNQSLVKELVKTSVKPLCYWASSRTFASFSKFFLNTPKSPNINVVQFVEGNTLLLGGIILEWKIVENLVNCRFYNSSAPWKTRNFRDVPAQTVEKNIGRPL